MSIEEVRRQWRQPMDRQRPKDWKPRQIDYSVRSGTGASGGFLADGVGSHTVIASYNGRTVGKMQLIDAGHEAGTGAALLRLLYAEVTDSHFRRQGIATEMWRRAVEVAQRLGAKLVHDESLTSDALAWIATLPAGQQKLDKGTGWTSLDPGADRSIIHRDSWGAGRTIWVCEWTLKTLN